MKTVAQTVIEADRFYEMEDETEKTFEKSEIALIRLAFDF